MKLRSPKHSNLEKKRKKVNLKKLLKLVLMAMMMVMVFMPPLACEKSKEYFEDPVKSYEREPQESGGGPARFKVPVVPGQEWEVTQSWGGHCQSCENKYPSADPKDHYCVSSHTGNCCKHSWDFNLPGDRDNGKSVLASGDGYLTGVGYSGGWGYYAVIDHGDNICTRYAHMLEGSIDHLENEQYVCQGMKLGEIGQTGSAEGYHLHFQFENCETGKTLAMGFDDGNDVPMCTIGHDVFNSHNEYGFLKLTNTPVTSCDDDTPPFGGASLPLTGWIYGACGGLSGCPLNPLCARLSSHEFTDYSAMEPDARAAASYLWNECAIDGKADGGFHPGDKITVAEGLKISMILFGAGACGDIDTTGPNWFNELFVCATAKGIVMPVDLVRANQPLTFAEAAKFVVKPAVAAGVVNLRNPRSTPFSKIAKSHWAYAYASTLYLYGGLVGNVNNLDPTSELTRRQFAFMAVSLSPCFCGNIFCRGSCVCNQAAYACTNPGDHSPGTGGSGSGSEDDDEDEDDEENEEEEDEDEEDDEDQSSGDFDLLADCEVESENSACRSSEVMLYVRCTVSNHGSDVVRINNLVMSMDDFADSGRCQVTDEDLRSGVGTNNLDPGESRRLTGHFEINCSERPLDGELQVKLSLVERVAGVVTLYEDLLEARIEVAADIFQSCGGGSGGGNSGGGTGSNGASGSNGGNSGCVPETCGSRVCGTWPDGCGGRIDCEQMCPANHHCTTMGQCEHDCVPASCQALGFQCGSFSDGCGGTVSCGSCPGNAPRCVDGQCQDLCGNSCTAGTQCINGQCRQVAWQCNPATGYRLWFSVPGGSYEMVNSGPVPHFQGPFIGTTYMWMQLDCIDLPAVVLLRGAVAGVSAWLEDQSLPSFGLWAGYNGPLTMSPVPPPDVVVSNFSTNRPSTNVLIRIPPP